MLSEITFGRHPSWLVDSVFLLEGELGITHVYFGSEVIVNLKQNVKKLATH